MGKNNGDVLVFGSNYYGQLGLGHNNNNINVPTLLMNDTTITNIICGISHPRLPEVTQGYDTYATYDTYTIIYKQHK